VLGGEEQIDVILFQEVVDLVRDSRDEGKVDGLAARERSKRRESLAVEGPPLIQVQIRHYKGTRRRWA
jgi:hypothetical protein